MFKAKIFTLVTLLALPVAAVIATEITPITPSNAVISVSQNEAFNELRQKLKLLPQFSANFKQQVFDTKGQVIQESDGSMSLQQPNKFRWTTNEPDESVTVSDGQTVWVYNPFVEQVTAIDLNDTVSQSPLWLIVNQSKEAWQQFDVSRSAQGYLIKSKDPKSLTRSIEMRFNGSQLSGLTMKDAQGQTSDFEFSQFSASPMFTDATFAFEMPQDVDFDDQREVK